MKKIIYFALVFIAIITNACSNDNIEFDMANEQEFNKSLEFIILEDEAKEFATNFLNKKEISSRSTSNAKVETIWRSIELTQSYTRSTSENTKIDIPIYVVTYTDEKNSPDGYVVTVGDKRVMNKTLAFSEKGNWDLSNIPAFENIFWAGVDKSLTQTLSESEVDPCDTYEYEENYTIQKFVADMLLEWDQSESPYNDSVPIYYTSTSIINMAAGCVPVSMAQIMAYHEHPASGYYIHEEYNRAVYPTYNWARMKTNSDATLLDNVGKSGVANLIAEIGHRANTYYATSSPTVSTNIKRTFTEMGYTSTNVVDFNLQTVINDIIESRPVYIHGTGSLGTHAWIIEGYKKDICDVIYGRDCPTGSGETNIPPTVIDQEVINYLYFNMGWGGQSNGFYLADTFASWDFNTRIGIIHNIQPSN